MGHDATNYISKKVKINDLLEFITLLGYVKKSKYEFSFFKEDNYKYMCGIYLVVYNKGFDDIQVCTHTLFVCSTYDIDFQNFTIKQLKNRFGGYFITDKGKNRYLTINEPEKIGIEAGLFQLHYKLENEISLADAYLMTIDNPNTPFYGVSDKFFKMTGTDQFNPNKLPLSLFLTLLTTMLEDYFKKLFIIFFKYSDKKEYFFKEINLKSQDVCSIYKNEISFEDAILTSLSFQNLDKIRSYFLQLNKDYDLHKILILNKKDLFKHFKSLINSRHDFIHKRYMKSDYTFKKAKSDLKLFHKATDLIYMFFKNKYKYL